MTIRDIINELDSAGMVLQNVLGINPVSLHIPVVRHLSGKVQT